MKHKRILSLILALSLLCTLLPAGAVAAAPEEEGSSLSDSAEASSDPAPFEEELPAEADPPTEPEEAPNQGADPAPEEPSVPEEAAPDGAESPEQEPSDPSPAAEGEAVPGEEELLPPEEALPPEEVDYGLRTIVGFPEDQNDCLYYEDSLPSLDEVLTQMPEEILAYVDGAEEPVSVPVTWSCTEDFEQYAYSVSIFLPQWDEEDFVLSDSFSVEAYMPFMEVSLPYSAAPAASGAYSWKENIVARAYQQVQMEWSPLSNVKKYVSTQGVPYGTFYKGNTYTGIPYGMIPTKGEYLPFQATFDTFLDSVTKPDSLFYTSRGGYSSYPKLSATYYANDCSAFVSYCYNRSRMTTTIIGRAETLFVPVSKSIYDAQIGDCLNKAGSHVILITDLIYRNGSLAAVELSEQTPPQAITHTVSVSEAQSKMNSGYELRRYSDRYDVPEPVDYTGYDRDAEYDREDSLKITGLGMPSTLAKGAGANIQGLISSSTSIKSVTVGCYDLTEKMVTGLTVHPDATSYQISAISDDVHFARLAPDTYHFRVTATDGSHTETLVDHMLVVESSSSSGAAGTAPQLLAAENTKDGICVSWKKVSGARGYAVLRKKGSENWTTIAGNVSDLVYHDTDVKDGTTYTYTVRAMLKAPSTADSNRYSSSCWTNQNTGLSVKRDKKAYSVPAQPELKSVENTKDGVKLTWGSVKRASGYHVYRKTKSSGWVHLKDSSSTSITDTDVTLGIEYTYTVTAYYSSGAGSYDHTGLSIVAAPTPVISSLTAESNAIALRWPAVKGASYYIIYRKNSAGKWDRIQKVSETSCKDTDLTCDGTYTYTIRAGSDSVLSSYDPNGFSCHYTLPLEQIVPKIKSVSTGKGYPEVSWEKVSSATQYRVYRKTQSSGWTLLGIVSSTSYADRTAKGGTYWYTVMAQKGSVRSNFDRTGYKVSYATPLDTAPKLTGAVSSTSGITVSWSAVPGASSYALYRKAPSGSWTRIATVTSTKHLDKSVQRGKAYVYTVRTTSGSNLGKFDPVGISSVFVEDPARNTPVLLSARDTTSAVVVQWEEIPNAGNYLVYRKTATSGWARIGTTKESFFRDTTAKTGTTYTYTVRCTIDFWLSGYNKSGVSVKYQGIGTPVLLAAKPESAAIQVRWEAVSGASSYRVLRKTASSDWTSLGDTASTSFTDKTASKNVLYTYSVRAKGKTGFGSYDTTGVSGKITGSTVPVLTAAYSVSKTNTIHWTPITGSKKYLVYRKTGTSGWTRIGETANSFFRDTTGSSGVTYTYTVRAYVGTALHDYDRTGISVECRSAATPPTPILESAAKTSLGVKISWRDPAETGSYIVYRKTGSSGWVRVTRTSRTSFTDATAVPGTTYYYTVRASDKNGLGDYDRSGIRISVK